MFWLLLWYTINLLVVLLSIKVVKREEEKSGVVFYTIAGLINLLSMINTALKII